MIALLGRCVLLPGSNLYSHPEHDIGPEFRHDRRSGKAWRRREPDLVSEASPDRIFRSCRDLRSFAFFHPRHVL